LPYRGNPVTGGGYRVRTVVSHRWTTRQHRPAAVSHAGYQLEVDRNPVPFEVLAQRREPLDPRLATGVDAGFTDLPRLDVLRTHHHVHRDPT
jgi:hypothetical protein